MTRKYLLLAIYLAVSNINIASGQSKQQLIDLAIELGAPFAKTALERLHGSIFGSGRAARSTDCIIINKSKQKFKLTGNSCSHGDYSRDLLPEPTINSKVSSVFGMESHGLFTGVECTTKYQGGDGSFFEVRANNPYVGSVEGSESFSQTLSVFRTTGGGNNNQMRWVVEDIATTPGIIIGNPGTPGQPIQKPTKKPTKKPTQGPTKKPTQGPTKKPTKKPTQGPTKKPTQGPTKKPTQGPTKKPTQGPTKKPIKKPIKNP